MCEGGGKRARDRERVAEGVAGVGRDDSAGIIGVGADVSVVVVGRVAGAFARADGEEAADAAGALERAGKVFSPEVVNAVGRVAGDDEFAHRVPAVVAVAVRGGGGAPENAAGGEVVAVFKDEHVVGPHRGEAIVRVVGIGPDAVGQEIAVGIVG